MTMMSVIRLHPPHCCPLLVLLVLTSLVAARGPPELTRQIEPYQLARVGDTIKLRCPVSSTPEPMLVWLKDDETIHAGWDRFRELNRAIRISNLELEDAGKYVCRATNGFGSIDVEYLLYVAPNNSDPLPTPPYDFSASNFFPSGLGGEVPRFSKPGEMRERVVVQPVESTARLRCRAEGQPKPSIEWYKGSQRIIGNEENVAFGDHEMWDLPDEDAADQQFALRLTNLKVEDSGPYTCRVSNIFGSINYTYTLEVVGMLSKPVVLDPSPSNSTVEFGDTAMFQCTVHSQVQPTIQWLKRVDDRSKIRNHNATFHVKDQLFVVLSTGKVMVREDGSYLNKLLIERATDDDAGMYVCLGANSMGYNFRRAFLSVRPNPFHPREEPKQQLSLPIIIAVPAGIILILIVIVIVLLLRRRDTSQASPGKPIVRQTRMAPPVGYTQNGPERMPYEQYAAVHAYHMQPAPSHDGMHKNSSDGQQSEVSQKGLMPTHSYSPPMSQMAPPYQQMTPVNQPMIPNYHVGQPPPTFHQHLHYAPC